MSALRAGWTWCRARLGLAGIAGVMAALAALYVHGALLPGREIELERTRARASRPATHDTKIQASPQAAPLALAQFPPADTLPDWLERVEHAAVTAGVAMARTEYAVSTDAPAALVRYQISLPVKGSYPQVRAFVSALLEAVPTLAINGLAIKRGSTDAAQVEARLDVAVYLRAGAR